MDENPSRTDLAGRVEILLAILVTAIGFFYLFSKVVNYHGRSVQKF
ncbi:hypothetical protein WBP06_25035 [Novosphingobium sp. BL-8H]